MTFPLRFPTMGNYKTWLIFGLFRYSYLIVMNESTWFASNYHIYYTWIKIWGIDTLHTLSSKWKGVVLDLWNCTTHTHFKRNSVSFKAKMSLFRNLNNFMPWKIHLFQRRLFLDSTSTYISPIILKQNLDMKLFSNHWIICVSIVIQIITTQVDMILFQ